MPEEILKYFPIIIPFVIIFIALLSSFRLIKKTKEYNKIINEVDQKIKTFKDKIFRSYEEESREKQQLRRELLLQIENKNLPKMLKKGLEDKINFL